MKSQTSKLALQAVVSLIAVFSLAGCSINSDDFPQIANPHPSIMLMVGNYARICPTSLRIAATRYGFA